MSVYDVGGNISECIECQDGCELCPLGTDKCVKCAEDYILEDEKCRADYRKNIYMAIILLTCVVIFIIIFLRMNVNQRRKFCSCLFCCFENDDCG